MISQKLIELLRSFNEHEIKRLGEFVNSPYHNKQSYVTLLYEEVIKHYPKFELSGFTREVVYRAIYPGKEYNDARMRNLTSDLTTLVERFISVENFLNDPFNTSVSLLEGLPEKQLDDMFERKYKKVSEFSDSNPQRNEIYYLNKFLLIQARSRFVDRRKPNDARENLECFQGIVNQSIKFFLATLFKNYALMLNRNITFFKYDYDTRFINIILEYMEKNPDDFESDTCILLYYYFTVFYLRYDDESFKRLNEFTLKNFEKFDRQDATNATINMVTFCRRQALAGRPEFEKKALSLFKMAIEKGLWDEDHLIRPSIFRTIVSSSCSSGELDWCERFLDEYKDLQQKEHIVSNTNLCYGRLYFDRKEYSKALDHLAKVVNLDSTYKYETDTLTIRIFYETGETEAFISKVDSFKKWVNNNKTVISERYRKIFTEMAGYFSMLIKLKLEPDEFEIQKMKLRLGENKTLVNRLWFLEKLKEL